MSYFHDRLRAVKSERGLTIDQMAQMCHTSWPTMQRWLASKSTPHRLAQDSVMRILDGRP